VLFVPAASLIPVPNFADGGAGTRRIVGPSLTGARVYVCARVSTAFSPLDFIPFFDPFWPGREEEASRYL